MAQITSLADVPEALRGFVAPQMEQLGFSRFSQAPASCAREDGLCSEMRMWVGNVGDTCLATAHRMTVARPFVLEEEPPRSLCIVSTTASAIKACPVSLVGALQPNENVATFGQMGQRTENLLVQGASYDSVEICLLPAYFDRLAGRYGGGLVYEARAAMDGNGLLCEGDAATYMRVVMRSLDGTQGASLGRERDLGAQVERAVVLALASHAEARRAGVLRGSLAQVNMAARVRALVRADMAHPPTVDQVASLFHMSRARACAVFKAEVGESVGAYVTRVRIERACELLSDPRMRVEDVARAVGYAHQSSFADAFKRATGMTPSSWRGGR